MQYSDEYFKILTAIVRTKQRMQMIAMSNQGQEVLDSEIEFLHYTVHRAALKLETLEEIKDIAQRAKDIINSFE